MPSQLKSETARANGAKSKGPVTPEGRARSSMNAVRHGLCSKLVVLHGEQPAEFEQLRDDYVQRFQPADQPEMDLVETLAISRWRLRRVPMLEVEVFEHIHFRNQHRMKDDMSTDDPAFNMRIGWVFLEAAKGTSPLSVLQRYEGQLTRTYERSLKALQTIQKTRPATPAPEIRNEPKEALLEPPVPTHEALLPVPSAPLPALTALRTASVSERLPEIPPAAPLLEVSNAA